MQVGYNNNSQYVQEYQQRNAATHSSTTGSPQQPGDSYGTGSLPSDMQNFIQNDPELEQAWQSLSPQQQQELEQLFGNGNGYTPPADTGTSTGTGYSNDDTYTNSAGTDSTGTDSTGTESGASGAVYGAQSVGANDPSITLKNTTNQTRYYYVEASAGQDPENLNGKVIAVPPGGTATVNPGQGFNGAITDNGTNSAAGSFGTRMEYNASVPGQVWYDADTERGNTNATFGATDGKNADDGRDGTVGNDMSHYSTHGAVAGETETAADKQSDLGTHVISNDYNFTLTSS